MLGDLIALLSVGSLALAPLVWRLRHDQRHDVAVRVQAGLQFKANQRLGGESFLVVHVEPHPLSGKGRVTLSTPDCWQWLVGEVWSDVVEAIPAGYELVVTAETVKGMAPVRPDMVPAQRIPPRGRVVSAARG